MFKNKHISPLTHIHFNHLIIDFHDIFVFIYIYSCICLCAHKFKDQSNDTPQRISSLVITRLVQSDDIHWINAVYSTRVITWSTCQLGIFIPSWPISRTNPKVLFCKWISSLFGNIINMWMKVFYIMLSSIVLFDNIILGAHIFKLNKYY